VIAPITCLDDQGRRILYLWINEARSEARHRVGGWAGMMALPRVLTLAPDDSLRIQPVPEITALRCTHRQHPDLHLEPDTEPELKSIQGDSLELHLEMVPEAAKQCGVVVRCSPDGAEQTRLTYDADRKTFSIDGTRSSRFAEEAPLVPILPEAERTIRLQSAPFALAGAEPLRLRIFLDRSIIEVYLNDGRQTLTQRIYPSGSDSLGVRVFSRGGRATVRQVEAWDMAPAGG
jgi:beta-fructofuranosidase